MVRTKWVSPGREDPVGSFSHHFTGPVLETFPTQCGSLSVDTEGDEALVTLAGEVSDQLTVAYHQKQAATYGTTKEPLKKMNS